RTGESVIREGQPGECYYVVVDGRLAVTQRSRPIATVARGDGVGEISLLAGVPCTATVTALEPVRLYALDARPFVEVVTRYATSAGAAQRLVRERLSRSAQAAST
ncbi:MAG: cyclic nucleotide-binding domain-containing protein, partial [Actinomycetota bacterium]|nr:cyclic nucleotide-binding domain-containing protein [Actinomycetota bacterium]